MKIIEVNSTDLAEIEGNRHRTFQAISTPLTAEVILNDIETHHRQRVIIICNTVSQAQGLFQDLRELNPDDTLIITLLHSRFLPEHRAKKEAEIQAKFSRNGLKDGQCHVLISTQVIEAGLNITCEVMHTELCPINSLLQRAGRCARFPDEQGEVYVYWQILVNSKYKELASQDFETQTEELQTPERKSFLPYQKELCELTWQVLQEHTQSDNVYINVGFELEQAWINQVHKADDSLQAERRKNNQAEFENQFNGAILRGERDKADDLIRFVDSRSLFVWNEPILIDFDDSVQIDPKKLLPFSVPITTLCRVWQDVQKLDYEIDWVFKRIEYPKGTNTETYTQPICTPIRSFNDFKNSFQLLANPRYVYYDEEIGLLIKIDEEGNNFNSPNKPQKSTVSEYQYRMDTYVGHLGCMWQCWQHPFQTKVLKNGDWVEIQYNSVRDELLQTGGQFIQQKIFPNATLTQTKALFEYLVLLAIFTHDLGKLQQQWQTVMRGWQTIAYQDFNGKSPKSYLLAHTDYNPEDPQQKQALKAYEKQHKRPNHAVESAFLALYILQQTLIPLLKHEFNANSEQISGLAYSIILSAGRHHSAWAKGWGMKDIKNKEIILHPDAQKAIAMSWKHLTRWLPDTLPLPSQTPNLPSSRYPIQELDLTRFYSWEYLQLYWLVVRALRLCDQRSVQL